MRASFLIAFFFLSSNYLCQAADSDPKITAAIEALSALHQDDSDARPFRNVAIALSELMTLDDATLAAAPAELDKGILQLVDTHIKGKVRKRVFNVGWQTEGDELKAQVGGSAILARLTKIDGRKTKGYDGDDAAKLLGIYGFFYSAGYLQDLAEDEKTFHTAEALLTGMEAVGPREDHMAQVLAQIATNTGGFYDQLRPRSLKLFVDFWARAKKDKDKAKFSKSWTVLNSHQRWVVHLLVARVNATSGDDKLDAFELLQRIAPDTSAKKLGITAEMLCERTARALPPSEEKI